MTKQISFYDYSIVNPKPGGHLPNGSGIKMVQTIKEGDAWIKQEPVIVPEIRAVLLFFAPKKRAFTFKPKPDLTKTVAAYDLIQIMSQFPGYTKTRIDTAVGAIKAGKLVVNGLPDLCPIEIDDSVEGYDPMTSSLLVKGYDIDNSREFNLELTGKSVKSDQRYTAPFWEFIRFLRAQPPLAGDDIGRATYEYLVTLKPGSPDNLYYYLDVTDPQEINNDSLAQDMHDRAHRAKAKYQGKIKPIESKPTEANFENPAF